MRDRLAAMCSLLAAVPQRAIDRGELQWLHVSSGWRRGEERIWRDDAGAPLAFAISLGRARVVHFEVDPRHAESLGDRVLAWALDRMPGALDGPAVVHAVSVEGDALREGLLGAHGFEPADTRWHQLEHPLSAAAPPVTLPDGYSLRALDLAGREPSPRSRGTGSDRPRLALARAFVDAWRASHPLDDLARGWPHRFSHAADLRPDTVLAAVDGGGEIAAFVVTWLYRDDSEPGAAPRLVGEIEPLATRFSARRRGLARLLFAAALHRLQQAGATCVRGRVLAGNHAALPIYLDGGARSRARLRLWSRIVEQNEPAGRAGAERR